MAGVIDRVQAFLDLWPIIREQLEGLADNGCQRDTLEDEEV
ncbi:MAG: hypothetical protein ABSH06_23745 [Thermodesulfobacteriota bacterium]|jgi:hypothetical protein